MSDYRELLIGCGNQRNKIIASPDRRAWENLTTLDIDPNCGADVEWDLEKLPLPFPDEAFDEVHAYHCLEHQGWQGDWRFLFAQFADLYRILRSNGLLCIVSPMADSPWAWGDPGHRRIISGETLTFLNQAEYTRQVGQTAMADYRHVWKGDFEIVWMQEDRPQSQVMFALKAHKPSRISL